MTTLHPMQRNLMSLPKWGLIGLMGLTLAGCQDVIGGHNAEGAASVEDKIKNLSRGGIGGKVPEVAIQVSDDLFMIPTGLDEDGCEMFKPHSTSDNPVKTAIYYRQADGGFGIARDLAVCKVDMVPMEPDDDGCERYRALPVNASVAIENEVYYYKAADDSYTASKPVNRCS